MTQISADAYQKRLEKVARHPAMATDNIHVRAGAGETLSRLLLGIGIFGLLATIAGAFAVNGRHALAAFEVGVFTVTAISLGGLFWVMVFYQTASGWSATIRRQLEHLMMMLPVCVAFIGAVLIIELAAGGLLLTWLGLDPAENYLLKKKQPFLNPVFLVIRFLVYAGVWMLLATRLWRLSVMQDQTGDRFLTNRAKLTSAWGLLLFALTTAFFAFDYLMALDFRFFSTMWGVYYFASTALGALAAIVVIVCVLRTLGYLTGLVTDEHTHDLGKLTFGFTVFWAYIAFGQYFLIWYSNIPEETAWFVHRTADGWQNLAGLLALGHFVIPFLVLLFRHVKRHPFGLAVVAAWIVLMIVADMIFIIRPMVYVGGFAEGNPGPAGWWLDIVGVVGVLGVWSGLLVRRIAANPLVAWADPRMPEALKHRNHV